MYINVSCNGVQGEDWKGSPSINKISRAKDDTKDSSIAESESKLPTAGREVRERSNEPCESCVAK